MNQNQVSNGRKKTYTRQWRFTEKPSSPNGPFPDYKSTSPKLQYEYPILHVEYPKKWRYPASI